MGRDTEIYIFNKDKASTKLYLDLKLNKIYETSFEEFIERRKNEFGNSYNHSYEKILNTIKDDINNITADELFELLFYLCDYDMSLKKDGYGEDYWKSRKINDRQEKCEEYGITLLYELQTTTACNDYMSQYGSYTHYYPIEEIKFDENDMGENISSVDFLKFNDCLILIAKRIIDSKLFDDGDYYLNNNEMDILSRVVNENEENDIMNLIVEKAFDIVKQDKDYLQRNGGAGFVYLVSEFVFTFELLKKLIEIKSKINPMNNPRVVIVDSW